MLKLSLTLILASFCLPAQANLLRIDYALQSETGGTVWLLPDPPPAQLHVAFTVDTLSADATVFDLFTDASAATCTGHFVYTGLDISDVSITSSTMSFGSDPTSTSGSFSGTNPNTFCPALMFGGMGFATDDVVFGGSIDYAGLTLAEIQASDDVMADLLFNTAGQHFDGHLNGGWGQLTVSGSATVTRVPEPATLALFGAALLGFGVHRLRKSATQP